jgi:hypothetical protein
MIIFLIFSILISVFIFLALADACSAGHRQQTRALIKAQRDLAIEKGEIKETTEDSGDWYSPENRKRQPVRVNPAAPPPPVVSKSPPKPVGERFNFATQKRE